MLTQFRSILALTAIAVFVCLSTVSAAPVLDNLLLHFDASAGVVADGDGNVSQWTNQAMDAHHAVSPSGSRPQLVAGAVGGRDAVYFGNNQNHYLSIPHHADLSIGQGAGQQRTMFMVFQAEGTKTSFQQYIGKQSAWGSGNTDWLIFSEADSLYWGTAPPPASGQTWMPTSEPTRNTVHMFTVDLEQTGQQAGTKNFWVDGALGATGPYGAKVAANNDPVYIGASPHQNWAHLDGYIAEIIAYDTVLNAAERRQVETYLANKYFAPVPADTLTLGHWPFDEKNPGQTATAEQRVVDHSGFGRHAWVGGSGGSAPPTYVSGAPGYTTGPALRFDSDTLPVTFQTSYDFDDGGPAAGSHINFGPDDSFTIEVLFRSEMTATGMLVTKDWAANQQSWWMRLEDGRPRFYMDGGAGEPKLSLHADEAVNDGEWHHLAVVRDREAEEVRMYLDHDWDPIFTLDEPVGLNVSNARNIGIGRQHHGGNPFIGDIDYVRISAGALSVNQFLIPEPTSLVLLAFGALAVLLRRGRWR